MHKLWHKEHKLLCCNYHQESFTRQNTCKHNKTYICYTNMEYNYKNTNLTREQSVLNMFASMFTNIFEHPNDLLCDLCVSSTQLIKTLIVHPGYLATHWWAIASTVLNLWLSFLAYLNISICHTNCIIFSKFGIWGRKSLVQNFWCYSSPMSG